MVGEACMEWTEKGESMTTGKMKLIEEMVPQEVTDVELAFPANIARLMPDYEVIPEEFKAWPGKSKWVQLVTDWFYFGLVSLKAVTKQGIDENKALRHIGAILGSYEPSHEHKTAGAAYLLSLWFEDATWQKAREEV